MAFKLKNINSPNQQGISKYILKNSQAITLPVNKQKCQLSSPDLVTPREKSKHVWKITTDLKLLYDSLSQKWDERMDPLEATVNALFSEESNLPWHIGDVNEIKLNQGKLETRLSMVEKENEVLKESWLKLRTRCWKIVLY